MDLGTFILAFKTGNFRYIYLSIYLDRFLGSNGDRESLFKKNTFAILQSQFLLALEFNLFKTLYHELSREIVWLKMF